MRSHIISKIKKAFGILKSTQYLRAAIGGVAAAVEHEKVLNSIEGIRTIVDIGANKGQFSLVARKCHPEATIIAFEPLTGPARHFIRALSKDNKVALHLTAIGPDKTLSKFHVSLKLDSSSLLPITDRQSEYFPGTSEKEQIVVSQEPLDSHLSAKDIRCPALLKIDVQGYELKVLKGSANLLRQFDYVYVECSFLELYEGQALAGDVIEHLKKKEYELIGVYNTSYCNKGNTIQTDLLFRKHL